MRLNTLVTDVDERGLTIRHTETGEQEYVDAVTKVWAAGVQASPLTKT
ncbi:MAG: hypothetical protein R2709_13190 [Marmoricola sp.]